MRKLAMMISIMIILLAACGNKEENKEENKDSNQLDAKKVEKKKIGKIHNNTVEANGVRVKVIKTEIIPLGKEEFQKKPLLVINYEVTNNSDREVTPSSGWYDIFQAYQDSENSQKMLNIGVSMNEEIQKEWDKQNDIIKKGSTVSSNIVYELENNTNVVLLKAKNIYTNTDLGEIKVNIKK
ncbi:DUF5067 domain-containing protein [Staphylococcus condimenti]|uniref:DUF5067 domain-containing protein n=1 Tax=Staphylococcus condimenti TaxID=70255 RepID=A0A4Q7CNL0_9STAP|nr:MULTISPECIES: DUF5067 domain-containing protein [Staphylococcus]APR61963.1 hypothetical protein BTZ13_12420 [Staphylococcus condimenti]MDK8645425.1 DUF5067 domain-containing protein [Staphylococcus condimenti]OFP03853.1 hypothetical protein HMPREF3007_07485 [Staphylococcus sp. HMSC065E08]RZI03234.1 DUF5067 domain-containing protein [Staphylococcus condimenti]RZI03590.1 DUF5067 domain-containing protein [Staphylococcus condimenti]